MSEVVREIITGLPMRYDGRRGDGFSGVVQLAIDDPDAGRFFAEARDGILDVREGTHPRPDARIEVNRKDFAALMGGHVSAFELVTEGRMVVRGSLATAARLYVLVTRR